MHEVMSQKNGQAAESALSDDTPQLHERQDVSFEEWRPLYPQQVIRAFLLQMKVLDPAFLQQTRLVTYYTLLMARKLNFTPQDERNLAYSSLLHDLGQLGMDRRIIEKRESLTTEEWEVFRAHPINSVKILSPFHCFRDISPIIKHHHERFDGTGYPDGLTGEQIPLMSRLIAVADAFVAMTSERPYRGALMMSDALETIAEKKGKQFDPKIASLFITAVLENLKRRSIKGRPAKLVDTDIGQQSSAQP